MNKKLFLGMFAAAGMLLATSCSNDELDAVQSGNEAQVTFNLGTEGGIATRAISDGLSAKKLICAVYDANKTLLDQIVINDQKVDANGQYVNPNAFQSGLTDNVRITLAKGQTYTIAFWAQNPICDAYDTDDLKAVTVDYTDGAKGDAAKGDFNNDDTRDAFFAAETFKVEGNKEIDVTLKRPFAQINVGVTAEDWEAAVASGIEIEKSAVVIKNVADEINLLTGAVKASDKMKDGITYTLNEIPDETLYVETDATKDGKEAYTWLSMSYILVDDGSESAESVDGAQKSTLNGLQYTFAPENGNNIVFAEGLAGAPVQRNWRTNILGKILTGDIQFNITIDPVYDGDYIYPDGTIDQELEFITTFGGTYTFIENTTIPKLRVDADVILNINENVTLTSGSAAEYAIRNYKGTTTINNKGIIASLGGGISANEGASVVYNGGELNMNSSSSSGRYLFHAEDEGSTIIINSGNFDWDRKKNQKRAYIFADEGTTVYVNGGNFGKASTRDGYKAGIMGEGTVIITGGTFGFDPTTWVANGYKAKKNGSKWYVVAADVDAIVTTAEELTQTIADATSDVTILLSNDITGDAIAVQKENVKVTIIGNQKTYNGVITVDGKSSRYATAGLTIQDVNFNGENVSADAYINLGDGNTNTRYTSNVTVKNCTFSYNGDNAKDVVAVKSYTGGDHNLSVIGCTVNEGMHSMLQVTNVEVGLNIAECKVYSKNGVNLNNTPAFKMNGCTFDTKGYAIRVGVNGSVNADEKTFYISNSTLESACEEGDAVIMLRDNATYSRLYLTNTTVTGSTKVSGNTEKTTISGLN